MLELERPTDYASSIDQAFEGYGVPEVVITPSEAEQPNLNSEVEVTETEQAIIAAAQQEGEFREDNTEFYPVEAETFVQVPVPEADEGISETTDIDPPDKPPVPPVSRGFSEGEDDGERPEEVVSEEISETQPPTGNTEGTEAAGAEEIREEALPEGATETIGETPEVAEVSERASSVVREIDLAAEPDQLDVASEMVAHQLLEDPYIKEDVTDVMQGENWHNLGVFGEEGELVGVATVQLPPDEPYAFLAYFVVDEAHRGRDLGSLLLDEVERFAAAAGATSLLLEAFPDSRVTDESLRRDPSTFFEHHGYEAFDPEDPVRRRKYLDQG